MEVIGFLFVCFWLHRVLVEAHGIFVEVCGIFFVRACGLLGFLSSCRAWPSLSLRRASSMVVVRRLSCPVACGI